MVRVSAILTVSVLCAVLAARAQSRSEEVISCHEDLNVRPVMIDGGWTLMRNDGTVLTSERYNSSDEFSDGLFLFSGRNEWDYLDTKGQVALAVEDKFIVEPFSEGLAAAEDKNGKSGCIDKSGNTVIPHRFGVMSRPFSEGLAAVELDKSWHYIDKVGTIAVSPALDGHPILLAGDFHSGLALIVLGQTGNSQSGYIDKSGTWAIPPRLHSGDFQDGLAATRVGDKLGFIDRSGAIRMPPQFSYVDRLSSEGLIGVTVLNNGQQKHGFINSKGGWVIRPRFDDARHFCDGLAPVKMKEKWGYINAKGTLAITTQFADAQAFDGGVASVVVSDEQGKMHAAYIDTKGNVLWKSKHALEFIEVD